jgi:hypothetical protein
LTKEAKLGLAGVPEFDEEKATVVARCIWPQVAVKTLLPEIVHVTFVAYPPEASVFPLGLVKVQLASLAESEIG